MEEIGEKTPRVSIIILSYQKYDGLYRTLNTILSQNYRNIEILISDDGSEEFPESEIAIWAKKHVEIKIQIRKNSTNLGTVAHANLAVSCCTGEYIKFLPPGDGFCSPDSLRNLVEVAKKKNAVILTSPSLVYYKNYENVRFQFPSQHHIRKLKFFTSEQLFSVISQSNFISAIGTIFHRKFFDEGGFDEEYRYLDDWPTWLSRLRQNRQIEVLEIPTVYYELEGISNQTGNAFCSELLHVDLLLCYEKEILPYKERLSPFAKWFVNYRYGKLTGNHSVIFWMGHFPAELYCILKRKIKNLVMFG